MVADRPMARAEDDSSADTGSNPRRLITDSTSATLPSHHQDYIHHVQFDTYGRRFATCSGDRYVRVWELSSDNQWTLTASWPAHKGPVSTLDWAHPEFGTLLATGGTADHQCKIWEEQSGSVGSSAASTTVGNSMTSSSRWVTRAVLTEARRSVTCVKFSPRQGLKLAVASSDGCVRVYEAIDVMNLSQWPLSATLQPFEGGSSSRGCTSVSWSTGRFEPPTLVAGGTGGTLVLYRYTKMVSSASGGSSNAQASWVPWMKIPPHDENQVGDILSVAWAPNVGRRYHLIASTQDQGPLRIIKLSRNTSSSNSSGSASGAAATTKTEKAEILSSHILDTQAWRVQWNVTGTVLACAAAHSVQMWKQSANGDWAFLSEVRGDNAEMDDGDGTYTPMEE